MTLGFGNAGARDSFANGGSLEIVRQAAIDVVGKDWKIDAIVDPSATPPGPPSASTPSTPPQATAPPAAAAPKPAEAPEPPAADEPEGPPAWALEEPAPADEPQVATKASPEAVAKAREAMGQGRAPDEPRPDPRAADADAHRDDPDVEDSGLAGAELLQRHLGAQVIEEIPHD
ncbi:DNA polymerase III, subunits gamma and tau (fragment) [metagenome]|uniref:DNA polymerase III, subunits gamma and tau n=1 Tax=metagenome TaxID=256318 RepID=A0A2P2CF96_9ZZZZ